MKSALGIHLWLAAALLLCVSSLANALPTESALAAASESFEQGLAQLETNAEGAREAFLQAAASYSQAIDASASPAAPLYYNRGNAYLLAGELAESIADYRLTLALDPSFSDAQANLTIARGRVSTRVDQTPTANQSPLALAQALPLPLRASAFLIGWAAIFGIITARTLGALKSALPACVIAGILTLAAGLLTAADLANSNASLGVLQQSTYAYTGPSTTAYSRAFTEPLAPGVETTIVDESRSGWLAVELRDGRPAWIPADSILRVDLSAR